MAMSEKEKANIRKGLEAYTGGKGGNLNLNFKVNHKLMGGLEVYIGDVYIDCSVASVVSRAEKIVRFGKDSTSA